MFVGKDDAVTVISDALLLQRFREGDETSFEALFTRHYDMVYGVLYRLVGTRQEAEELAQEVFLKLYRNPLRRGDNVAGWLYRVALNLGYNDLRTTSRRQRRERVVARESSSVLGPEDTVVQRETRHRVRQTLAGIPPRAAKMLLLRESGFSYKEIADVVGVAPGSVGTLLARAQQAFQEAYGKQGGEGDATSE